MGIVLRTLSSTQLLSCVLISTSSSSSSDVLIHYSISSSFLFVCWLDQIIQDTALLVGQNVGKCMRSYGPGSAACLEAVLFRMERVGKLGVLRQKGVSSEQPLLCLPKQRKQAVVTDFTEKQIYPLSSLCLLLKTLSDRQWLMPCSPLVSIKMMAEYQPSHGLHICYNKTDSDLLYLQALDLEVWPVGFGPRQRHLVAQHFVCLLCERSQKASFCSTVRNQPACSEHPPCVHGAHPLKYSIYLILRASL